MHVHVMQSILTDYEVGLTNALLQEFPSTNLHGCYFHHTEAIYRKIQSLGLTNLYRDDSQVRATLRQLMALGHLPAARIGPFFENLRSNAAPGLETLFQYYQRYWIEDIGPDRFSVYELATRTNNNLESWHAAFNKFVGKSHPNIYEIIDCLRKEQAHTEHLIEQIDLGKRVVKPSKFYQRLSLRVARIKERYSNGSLSDAQFTNAIANCLPTHGVANVATNPCSCSGTPACISPISQLSEDLAESNPSASEITLSCAKRALNFHHEDPNELSSNEICSSCYPRREYTSDLLLLDESTFEPNPNMLSARLFEEESEFLNSIGLSVADMSPINGN